MLKSISPQDMREMERAFLEGTGYPSLLLMEHAAQAVVRALSSLVPEGAKVLFLCGGGNNGGDGCAAARLWIAAGGRAEVWLLRSPAQMRGDAGINARLLHACGANLQVLYGEVPPIPEGCAAVVDALFGTGFVGALAGEALLAAQRVCESALPVIAVDIPSGVDGMTGAVAGEAIRASLTVALHRPKTGQLLFPGRAYGGRLVVAPIGILPDWDGADGAEILEEQDARALLPARAMDAHKGDFGHVLLLAGREGMGGAAALAALGALRAGCGLVTAACSGTVLPVLQSVVPCAMARVVCEGEGLCPQAAEPLLALAQGKAALAIGPGLGTDEGVWQALSPLIEGDIPKVVDADALTLLARHGGRVGRGTVLTPHPGEMARLLGLSTSEVVRSPVECAQKLAATTGATVLLKGATTVIATGEELALNLSGSDAMATGGSGDVLTGVIAGLLAQGMSPFDASRVGAYHHGLAGEAACAALGARATTALDIANALRLP